MDGEARAGYHGYYNNSDWTAPQRTPAERLKEILETRQAPYILTRRLPVPETADIREQRARETLRRVSARRSIATSCGRVSSLSRRNPASSTRFFLGMAHHGCVRPGEVGGATVCRAEGRLPAHGQPHCQIFVDPQQRGSVQESAIKHSVDYVQNEPLRHYRPTIRLVWVMPIVCRKFPMSGRWWKSSRK